MQSLIGICFFTAEPEPNRSETLSQGKALLRWEILALVPINAPHRIASVFINDNESGLHHDYEVWIEKLAPHEPIASYHHNRTGEDNADAHLKRQIMVASTMGEGEYAFS